MSAIASRDTEDSISAYAGALADHLAEVERFLELAREQTEAVRLADADALTAIGRQRDRAMAQLLDTAARLAPQRRWVESLGSPWTDEPAWQAAASSRQRIRALVTSILEQDEATRALLETAAGERQAALQELDAANATLNAYRRALTPVSRPASLLDHRG